MICRRRVVSKLLVLALQTAGAELCLLVLDKAGALCAEAVTTSDSSEVKHLRTLDPIDAHPTKCRYNARLLALRPSTHSLLSDPCSVINYVARTRQTVTSLGTVGGTDPYMLVLGLRPRLSQC